LSFFSSLFCDGSIRKRPNLYIFYNFYRGQHVIRAHIARRLNSGFDREIGALPPHIYYINWGGLVRASGFMSGFRRPAM
jgi:hypothetical protein